MRSAVSGKLTMLKRLFASATLNTWMSLGVRIGGMLFLLPLVLTTFDIAHVLVWQLQASILMMLVWIDFGFSPTFARFIALTRGGATLGQLRQIVPGTILTPHPGDDLSIDLPILVGTLFAVNAVMAVIGLCLVGGIGTWAITAPIAALGDPAEGWSAWSLTLCSVPFALLNSANASILIGSDRITTLRRIETVMGLCQVLSNCVAVVTTANLAVLAASNTFWLGLNFLTTRYYAHKTLQAAGCQRGAAAWNYAQLAWSTGWRSGLGVLFSTGLIQGSGMVMPQLANAESAAAYLLILRLTTLASQISQAPFYSYLPAMTKTMVEGDRNTTLRMAQRGMSLSLWTLILCLLSMLFVAPPVLMLLGSSVQIPDQSIAIVMCLAFFFERYGAMHMQIYTLSNHVIWHKANGFTGLLMIVACLAGWPIMGVMAMPVALLVAYAGFLCPGMSTKALCFLQVPRWPFEKHTTILPFLVLLLGIGISLGLNPA